MLCNRAFLLIPHFEKKGKCLFTYTPKSSSSNFTSIVNFNIKLKID